MTHRPIKPDTAVSVLRYALASLVRSELWAIREDRTNAKRAMSEYHRASNRLDRFTGEELHAAAIELRSRPLVL